MDQIFDSTLVERVMNGDIEAFSQLVDRYKNATYALVLSRIQDFHTAEDVAQEAFLDAYMNLSALNDASKFSNWLRMITLNRCRMWLRRQKDHILAFDEIEPSQMMDHRTPEEHYRSQETKERVLEAIGHLSEKSREVILLFYIEGYSYQDIAALLNVPTDTVRSRLKTGRDKLREEMIEMVKEILREEAPNEVFKKEIDTMLHKAAIQRSKGQMEEALQIYREAIVADPSDPRIYHLMGLTYLRACDWESAAPALEKAFHLGLMDAANLRYSLQIDPKLILHVHGPKGTETVRFSTVIQEALEIVQTHYKYPGIAVETDFSNDLPVITGDRTNLRRACSYIIQRAFNAVDPSEGRIDLVTYADQHNLQVLFECRDNGPNLSIPGGTPSPNDLQRAYKEYAASQGITVAEARRRAVFEIGPQTEEGVREHLFFPYFPTSEIKRWKDQDDGPVDGVLDALGLYLARHIIWKHKGTVDVWSNPPRGVIIVVELPAHRTTAGSR